MDYIVFGTIIIILIILLILNLNKRRLTGDLEKIRQNWGSPKSKTGFPFVRISSYANSEEAKFHRLTDQTLEDIDFHRLFAFIDRTTSKVGQQFLYKKLIEPSNDTEITMKNLLSYCMIIKFCGKQSNCNLLSLILMMPITFHHYSEKHF